MNPRANKNAESNAGIKRASNFGNFDVYILYVSTHKQDDMYVPDVNGLMSVAQQIAEQAPDGALVCIESTIPRGMTRKIFDLFGHRLHVAHVPHR
jgi:UDP-N-acetyl-D-mannosaminuronate dehydrogenase